MLIQEEFVFFVVVDSYGSPVGIEMYDTETEAISEAQEAGPGHNVKTYVYKVDDGASEETIVSHDDAK